MNFCTMCGARLLAGGRFCTSCGAPLAASTTGLAAATQVGEHAVPRVVDPAPVDSAGIEQTSPRDDAVTAEQVVPWPLPAPLWQTDEADSRPPRPPRPTGQPGRHGILVPVAVAVAVILGVTAVIVVHQTYGGSTAAPKSQQTGKTSDASGAASTTPPSGQTDQAPPTAAGQPVVGTAEPGLPPGEHDVAPLADITAPASAEGHVDESGRTATYPATAMVDTDPATAWRMNGDGTGQTITLTFGRPVTVTGLALDPGFDKVGSKHEDRWPENRRISAATFTTDDGSAFAVGFATDASLRASGRLQTFMLPAPVTTTTVTVHIDATEPAAPGTFDTTAISRFAVLGS
jgi:hypothetical protein